MDKHDKKTKMDTALLKVIRIILVDGKNNNKVNLAKL